MGKGQSLFVDKVGRDQGAFAVEVVAVRRPKLGDFEVVVEVGGNWRFVVFEMAVFVSEGQSLFVGVVLVARVCGNSRFFVVAFVEVVVLVGGGQGCFDVVEVLVIKGQGFVKVVAVVKGEIFFDAESSVGRRLKSNVGGVMMMPDEGATLGTFGSIFLTGSGLLNPLSMVSWFWSKPENVLVANKFSLLVSVFVKTKTTE